MIDHRPTTLTHDLDAIHLLRIDTSMRGKGLSLKDASGLPQGILDKFSSGAQGCIRKLQAHRAVTNIDCGHLQTAAVLVALYETAEKDGLRVLLTTRATTLRSHPGQTALPGGKVDKTDVDADYAARREAYEEVGLPLGYHPDLHKMTELEPFLSKYKLVVFPVVYLISNPALLESLVPSPDEVGAIFDIPLEYCLTAVWPGDRSLLSKKGSDDWPYEDDYYARTDVSWMIDGEYEYRMNRLRTSKTPLKGLTSDVLISVAEIAFETPSTIPRFAPKQLPFKEAIQMAVEESKRGSVGGKPESLTRELSKTPEPVSAAKGGSEQVPEGPVPAL
ncbi:NUDIX hydrolase domain-like protein [Filobasidium floriforme]|uniref:NUDIX hydrolase domain-like protein n=1 Tax=Filobasidium floriforme TaxID=5210 RepID=UPI001E8D2D5D|nr:NUDIX hydrolase domain-like protein [Filobasidium floriforme]KAH8090769.1 NUDIX hydrolase domain-like protein [Filobasidium floriforme]